jgi:hypothetical protein
MRAFRLFVIIIDLMFMIGSSIKLCESA